MNNLTAGKQMLGIGVQRRIVLQGFSLMELMIALLIGSLITLALVAVFLNISRTNQEMAKTNNQIDAARTALQIFKEDVTHAGFWGTFMPQYDDLTTTGTPGDVPTEVPLPCLAYASWDATYLKNLIGVVIDAYDAVPSGCSDLVTNKKANTDILIVRHAETCVAGVEDCAAAALNNVYFQASSCNTQISGGSKYLIAKQVSPTPFTLKKRDCSAAADIRKLVSSIYYIRDFARVSGDGIPTLVRSQFGFSGTAPAFQPVVPLVEGIEGFTVELGIDSLSETGVAVDYTAAISWESSTNLITPTNRGDGRPDGAYIRCTTAAPCTVAQLPDVVELRIHLLARAETPSPDYTDTKTYALGSVTLGPFNDKFKRHVFSENIRVNNVSARRETP